MTRTFLAFVALVGLSSCHQNLPPPTQPILVRAHDLARAYRADRSTADLAYTHQPVTVSVTGGILRGHEVHWHVSDPGTPAVIVFQFDRVPEFTGGAWITGTCRGAVRDGKRREFDGYDFTITISDCRIVPPPAKSAP